MLDVCLNSRPVRGSPFRLRAHHEVKGSTELVQRRRSDSRIKSSSTSGGGSSYGGSGSLGQKRPASSQSHGSHQQISSVDDDLLLRIGSQGRNKGQFMNPQVCVVIYLLFIHYNIYQQHGDDVGNTIEENYTASSPQSVCATVAASKGM